MVRHGKMLTLIGLAVSLLALTLASAEQCGIQADGATCPNGLCCSQFGFCGCGDPYCGEGCQSQCGQCPEEVRALGRGHDSPQCGIQADGATCDNGLCCSQFGFCGCGDPYCGEGCQSQCGQCPEEVRALGRGHDSPQCGIQADGATCDNGLCCSQFGFCGCGDPYCGEGCQSQCGQCPEEVRALGRGHDSPQCGIQADGATCDNGLCCSQFGFCGCGDPYCGEGCQSQCGQCPEEVRALGRGHDSPQCGIQADGATCDNGLCCSQFGFCGCGDPYCGEGCQSQCGQCPEEVRALGRGHDSPQCGIQADGATCDNGLCCSQFGFCGCGDPYCGEGCQSQCGQCPSHGGLRASTGKASYYTRYVPSACYGNNESHFPRNRHMAAVSDGHPNLWKNGQGCGKHYRVRCEGSDCRNGDAIIIKVVDRCPNGCEGRVFDLSEEAFGALADKNAGVIKVQYEPVNSADAIPWAQKKLIAEVGRIRK